MTIDTQPAPIGPTPLSPDDVARMIRTEMRTIGALIEEIQLLADNAAKSETEYKVKFAQQRLKAWHDAEANGVKMTVDRADDIATVATEDERLRFLTDMQILSSAKVAERARSGRLNSLQTLAQMAMKAGG